MEFQLPPTIGVAAAPVSGAQAETDFRRWRDMIADAANRLEELSGQVYALGNELFGAEPQPVDKHTEIPDPHCQVAALDQQIERLRTHLNAAENRFSRLRRLA